MTPRKPHIRLMQLEGRPQWAVLYQAKLWSAANFQDAWKAFATWLTLSERN